jgi:hypothetical protein
MTWLLSGILLILILIWWTIGRIGERIESGLCEAFQRIEQIEKFETNGEDEIKSRALPEEIDADTNEKTSDPPSS